MFSANRGRLSIYFRLLSALYKFIYLLFSFIRHKGKEFLERLRVLGLKTLKRRRIKGNLLETYKILSGKEYVSETFFYVTDSDRYLRGHSLKLYKRHCRLDTGSFLLSQSGQQLELPAEVHCESTFSQLVQEKIGRLLRRCVPALMLMLLRSIIHKYKYNIMALNVKCAALY